MTKKGVGHDLLFWIAVGTITLLVLGVLLYAFGGGSNDIINNLPL